MSAELLQVAVEAARAAAELVRERSTRAVEVADTKSSATDVVTEADRAAEELIHRLIAERRPDDGFLGEEGDEVLGTTGVRWVVDPIDGTVNFLYGLEQYAVSIAAEVDGEAVAGVVVDVARGVEYTGVVEPQGPASYRDGRRLAVRPPTPLAQRLVATGFSYDAGVRAVQADAMTRLLPRIRDIRRLGSCALDLCHVAEGRLDGYVEEGVNPWDHAAAGLIARAAGARTELMAGAGGLTLLLCAPDHGFDELRAAVVESGLSAE